MDAILKSGLVFALWMIISGMCYGAPTRTIEVPNIQPPPLPEELLRSKPTPPTENVPDSMELFAKLEQFSELVSLSPEQLTQLRMTIEFIERMTPEERELMRSKLLRITQSTQLRKLELRGLLPLVKPSMHSDLTQFWMTASEEDRKSIQQELGKLSGDKKAEYLAGHIQSFIQRRNSVFSEMKSSLANVDDSSKN